MLEISSELFVWDSNQYQFTGEASVLECELSRQGHVRLDYRNGEWGFHMRSQRTGRTLWFKRESETRDQEGELVYVKFRARKSVNDYITLLVFND